MANCFKVPGLRNVEFTGPYFHNGGQSTLEQVVEFYNRGGNFAVENRDNLAPFLQALFLTNEEKAGLVAFLKSSTDERLRFEKAPFDHPSISVPNGGNVAISLLFGVSVKDVRIRIPAVGGGGNGVGLGTPATPFANFLQQLRGAP